MCLAALTFGYVFFSKILVTVSISEVADDRPRYSITPYTCGSKLHYNIQYPGKNILPHKVS